MTMIKFALCGLGFISDRHIQSINEIGGELVDVCDIDTKKEYKANGANFYIDFKEMIARTEAEYITIATPNWLHASMIELALARRKKIICEKPPIIKRGEFNRLKGDKNLNIVLQCRYAPFVKEYKKKFDANGQNEVKMTIEVHRDDWYMKSWKADLYKSGGLLYNIGCHYFDLLVYWFGRASEYKVTKAQDKRWEGELTLEKAKVSWTVAIDAPIDCQKRIFEVNGEQVNLTQMGFESLHRRVYEEILKGNGYKLEEFEPTMDLIENLYAC